MQPTETKIVFYDGECALCNKAVRFLLKADKKQKFKFAPLNGEMAKTLKQPPPDSLILLDNSKEYRFGKGALRIAWHLGGLWRIPGVLSFLPTFLADAIYKLIAKNRHLFQIETKELPSDTDRFLP